MTANAKTNKPGTPEEFLAEANRFDAADRIIDAIVVLREMTQRWPGRLDGLSKLSAMLVVAGGRDADALDVAERALMISPIDVCALAHGGHAAYRLGNLELAKKYFQRLVIVNPTANHIIFLAKTHARLGENEETLTRIVEGIALMDDQTILREKRLRESITLLAECTHLPEDFPPELTAIVRGSQALIAQRRGEAHREFHSVVSNADANPAAIATAHTLLGELWRTKKTT